MNISHILVKPVLTEKSVAQEAMRKYTFVVGNSATKVDVKTAVSTLYGAEVERVNILHGLPKYKLGKGRFPLEKRQASRRAIITLKEGSKLDLSKTIKSTQTAKAA